MVLGDLIFGSSEAYAGVMRVAASGSDESLAAERIVMYVDPLFTGKTKLPMNVAPACKRIVSPGCALFSAAWKSPPALTTIWPLPLTVGGGGGGGGAMGAALT